MKPQREELKAAIEAKQTAEKALNQAQETLDRAGEYVRKVEAELAVLQARNQSEIAKHGRQLVEAFKSGSESATAVESQTAAKLLEAERKYEAAAAAYAELERELSMAQQAAQSAEQGIRNAACAVVAAESEVLAIELREAETRTLELRVKLHGLSMIGSSLPNDVTFISIGALDAIQRRLEAPYHWNPDLDPTHNATRAWRGHLDRLMADPEDLHP